MSAIEWLTGCDRTSVWRWCLRFDQGGDWRDRTRSGRPVRLTDEIRVKTVAFYCQVSPLPGCSRWSYRWAERYLEKHRDILGRSISRSSLQRLLTSQALRPHRRKYFLQITDPDFFPKMEALVKVYLHPPKHLFCLDECPCLQALQRCNPTLTADLEGHPHYVGFDYERLGTTDLIAILQPTTGQVFGRCMPNHTTQTLCRVFGEHVALQPTDVPLHYVMDNLSPHFHDDFCRLVAELSGVSYTPLRRGSQRRAWLESEDKRIVLHFTPFHGSWLNLVEIWFGILNQKCLKDLSVHSLAELVQVIEDFIRTWDELYAHPFTWKYTGEGLQAKAVRRFNRLLLDESPHMDAKFLTRQFELIVNIGRDYPKTVSADDWLQLRELAVSKRDYTLDIISRESGPRRQQWAREAFQRFHKFLAG